MNSISSVLFRLSLVVVLATALDLDAEEGGGIFDDQGINANDPALAAIRRLQESEELGIQLYRNGNYERAYEILSETAGHGFKDSQHAMALMYIRGEGVDKSPLIGTALFGLAAESGDRTLQRDYGKLLKSIPDKYRAVVEAQVAFYIERYGMEVQGIACSTRRRPQSNLTATECIKQPGVYEEFPWDP